MPFTFTENFDYYPLFEACMSDPDWNELADDPEDFDEFCRALKAGTFIPKD